MDWILFVLMFLIITRSSYINLDVVFVAKRDRVRRDWRASAGVSVPCTPSSGKDVTTDKEFDVRHQICLTMIDAVSQNNDIK
jgi:hypothetical protein